ncbi:MAG: restriction endonuclease subunit S [Nitrospira sp.]|nr:restriction endonuclease subunit S [Nitrospira sp.]
MSKTLPQEWVRTCIGDLVFKGTQRKPDDEESFVYIDIGSVDRDRKAIVDAKKMIGSDAPSRARKIINEGDVLVSLTRPNLNAVALVPAELDRQIASTGFEVLKTLIDSRYLFAIVRSQAFVESISGKVQGALYPAAKPADVHAYEMLLPPLAEQKQIANKLDELLAQVDSIKTRFDAIPAILKRFRQSVLTAAVSGRLTEDWRAKNGVEEPTQATVGDVCESSFYGPRFGKNDYVIDGVPTIRTTDMTGTGSIVLSKDTPMVHVPKEKVEQFRLLDGDLLITRTGSIGVMAVFRGDALAIPSAYLIRFRFTPDVDVDYMFHYLTSPIGQYLMGLGTTAVTQPNINAKTIKAIPILLPSFEEQAEINARVKRLFSLASQIEQRLTEAQTRINQLTQSILAKAFRGELTADWREQHPELISGEHSAEALLAQIQAARAKLEPKKRVRRKKVAST